MTMLSLIAQRSSFKTVASALIRHPYLGVPPSLFILHPSSLRNGFTLIEILVVMFIIGIIIAVAAVNFSRSPRDVLKTEAEQLSLLLQQARDDAITSGEMLAWKSENQVHAFYRLDGEGKWQPIERDEHFGVRRWPGDMRVASVNISGVKAATTDAFVFTPSGFNAPFDMTLALSDARIILRADPLGRIEIRE